VIEVLPNGELEVVDPNAMRCWRITPRVRKGFNLADLVSGDIFEDAMDRIFKLAREQF
jgi:hypothetical protein